MIVRSKAPLRLGLAGGGTDVSPYSDDFGGAVLNATINLYAYATIKPRTDGKIILKAIDRGEEFECEASEYLETDGLLDLHKGVYNRILKDFGLGKLSFELSTYVDAPAGSGLGTSSTLTVAILGAFDHWLGLALGEYDLAHLAYEIERIDLEMAGGKQDQYAAAFGGFNFMEFYSSDKVIVNPLRVRRDIIAEFNHNMLLYYTGTSRLSAKIIDSQTENIANKNESSLEGMHQLKKQAIAMKEAILRGELNKIGKILNNGWKYKKQLTDQVTNPLIDDIYNTALGNGAIGGKISGAGGGGFIMFYCQDEGKHKLMKALKKFGGEFRSFEFTKFGLESWTVK
jgi:D-glycero-alpha-D-manno-heptose-7-phosphate kinase